MVTNRRDSASLTPPQAQKKVLAGKLLFLAHYLSHRLLTLNGQSSEVVEVETPTTSSSKGENAISTVTTAGIPEAAPSANLDLVQGLFESLIKTSDPHSTLQGEESLICQEGGNDKTVVPEWITYKPAALSS